jgi:hypothetical protein
VQCKEPRGEGSSGATGVHEEDGCLHNLGELLLPFPLRLSSMLNIVLLIVSFLEKWMERFPCYYIFIFREREMEDRGRGGGGGTIDPRLGNHKKKRFG